MDEESLQKGFEEAVIHAGHIDILINNGLEGIGKDLTNISFEEFNRHQVLRMPMPISYYMKANNAGYFALSRCLRDHCVGRDSKGSIVLIGSMYGQVASYPGHQHARSKPLT